MPRAKISQFGGRTVTAAMLVLAGSSTSMAQDSTASSTGQTDALPAYEASLQRLRYVVDMSPITSSWGGAFVVAPVLKTPAEVDPLFSSQMAGATGVSVDHATGGAFTPRTFARWTAPGVGLHPSKNTAPIPGDALTVTGFTRRFAVAQSGVSAGATNIVSAIIGQDASNPARLFVERTVALCSRASAGLSDTATLAAGGIESSGTLVLRADAATAKSSQAIRQDNIVLVTSTLRDAAAVPTIWWDNELGARTSDAAAVSFVGAGLGVAVTIPALMPGAVPVALSLDFGSAYLTNAAVRSGAQASSAGPLRGSPTYSTLQIPGLSSSGTVACLARGPGGGSATVGTFNAFAVDGAGAPVPGSSLGASIPSPLNAPGGFVFNSAGRAEFRHYRNQSLFRGPHGHVAVGFDPPTASIVLAAVASDPDVAAGGAGEALLVARMSGSGAAWSVAAREGTPITDGASAGAAVIATIASGSPVTFSAPAMDTLGNIYVVATITPSGGAPASAQALLKGVRTPASPTGYTFERLLQSGQIFTGANSTRPITITRLRLADSDSIDSGGFHAGSLLQPRMPGATTTDAASPSAFGGATVNAVITYDAATPAIAQRYEATLFIAPAAAPPVGCVGDFNGDGSTNTADLVMFLSRFGQTVTPGATGDLNSDGSVNTQDLTRFLSAFGCVGR